MRRVLITGAGGFIGSHMIDRCVENGDHVFGVDIKPEPLWTKSQRTPQNIYSNWDIAQGLPVQEFDVCFHLAALARIQPSYTRPDDYCSSNIVGTKEVLQHARRCGMHVVYAGSSACDGEISLNVYATTKYGGEIMCRVWHTAFEVPVSIARFYNVYGPREIQDGDMATVLGIFRRQYAAGDNLTVTGDGNQRRDFTHIDDICDGLMAIAEKGKGEASIYSLGTGENYSVNELARLFVDEDRITHIPKRPGEMRNTKANVMDWQVEEIGWAPRRNVREWIKQVKDQLAATAAG